MLVMIFNAMFILLGCFLAFGLAAHIYLRFFYTKTVKPGQIWKRSEEDPFIEPAKVEVVEVKGGWVRYWVGSYYRAMQTKKLYDFVRDYDYKGQREIL